MVIDFCKLNKATKKDHYPLPFIDQMLENCLNIHIFAFYMVILVSLKYMCQPKINQRLLLHALLVLLLIDVCLLVYVMHLLPFKDA